MTATFDGAQRKFRTHPYRSIGGLSHNTEWIRSLLVFLCPSDVIFSAQDVLQSVRPRLFISVTSLENTFAAKLLNERDLEATAVSATAPHYGPSAQSQHKCLVLLLVTDSQPGTHFICASSKTLLLRGWDTFLNLDVVCSLRPGIVFIMAGICMHLCAEKTQLDLSTAQGP